MKNQSDKIKAILEYENEIIKARTFYMKDNTINDIKNVEVCKELNAELRGIREVKKILDIK